MIDLKDIESLAEPEITLKDTNFRMNKMPAMKGHRTLVLIREEVGKLLKPEAVEPIPDLARITMTIPSLFVFQLQDTMFEYVEFWNAKTTPQKVKDAEDMAFDGLEPGCVSEILIRSLVVNFTPSFRGIIDQISRALALRTTPRKPPKG